MRILLLQLIFSRNKPVFFPVSFQLAKPAGFGLVAVLFLSLCLARPSHAEPAADYRLPSITVVESERGGHYSEFTNALREILSAQGNDISVADPSSTIQGSSLVIGVGMKAASAAAASSAPLVLNVLIPKAGHEKLVREFLLRAQAHSLSAIYLDQPADRQVELITAAFPGLRNVGVLYSSPPQDLARLRREMARHGRVLHEQEVTPTVALPAALRALLQNIDVLLALPDPEIYNSSTIRNILLATYRAGIPLVGFSPGYVNAGAFCAVSSTPRQIAMQTARLINQVAETGKLPDAQYPEDFSVWVNEQVAHSLGIQVGEPADLRDIIKAAERKSP